MTPIQGPRFGYGDPYAAYYAQAYGQQSPASYYQQQYQQYDPYAAYRQQYAYDPYAAYRQQQPAYYQPAPAAAGGFPGGDGFSMQAPPQPQPEAPASKQPSLQDLLGPNGLAELNAASQRNEAPPAPPQAAEAPQKTGGGFFGLLKKVAAVGLGALGIWKIIDFFGSKKNEGLPLAAVIRNGDDAALTPVYKSKEDKEKGEVDHYIVVDPAHTDANVLVKKEDTHAYTESEEDLTEGAEEAPAPAQQEAADAGNTGRRTGRK